MKENQKIIDIQRKAKKDEKLAAPTKKKKGKFNVINLLFSIFVLYFAYTAFNQYTMLNELNVEIDKKRQDKAKVEREVQELQKDVEKMNDEESLLELVEKIARDQYKMVKPNETIYIDKNKNDNKLIQGIGFEKELEN